MSAIASFTLLPKAALDELRAAAVPTLIKGKAQDNFLSFLAKQGKSAADYDWSGYIIATLLPYLEQEKNIDLMNPDFENLGEFLTKIRENATFVLTEMHRNNYLSQLSPSQYSESELREFFERFNETQNPDSGQAMLDGISALQKSLAQITPESVVLVQIG